MSDLNPTANDWKILAECFMKLPNHRGRKGWVSVCFDETDLTAMAFVSAAQACYGSDYIYVYSDQEARVVYGPNTIVVGVNYATAPRLSDVLSIECDESAGPLKWKMVGDLRKAMVNGTDNNEINRMLIVDLNNIYPNHEYSCSYWFAKSEERLVQLRESIANELGLEV